MPLNWFNVREAAAVGVALADQFVPQAQAVSTPRRQSAAADKALQEVLHRAEREVQTLRLNFFKRAKLANAFKWRLLEKGVESKFADDATQVLVTHLMMRPAAINTPIADQAKPSGGQAARPASDNVKALLTLGNDHFARGEHAEALAVYQRLVEMRPRHAEALNNVGAALCKLSRFREAEKYFQRAIGIKPDYAEAHSNLGAVQQWKGLFAEAEASLRRALKLKPSHVDARSLLGVALVQQGRLTDAMAQFEKALRVSPRHIEALLGMGQVCAMDGRFDEADIWYKRALAISPKAPAAWAALAGLRRMQPSDGEWLERATEIAAGEITPTEQAAVRFAIGKYCDDIGDYGHAFQSYKRANDILKELAEPYPRDLHTRFVDDLMRAHTREVIARVGEGASDSMKPVLVVGMMRSGSTLVEQIIASHPEAKAAGELGFWSNAGRKHEAEIRRQLLGGPIRERLAAEYLQVLAKHSAQALRVVDKALVNADYLGMIHSVFPRARIIYVQRDPIDTCLSCYFQQFSQVFNYTRDLADLAHYYRQHRRLMNHWRAVLPAGTVLEVRYEDLVADQAAWTRKMLEFIGLEWDPRCLDFHKTERGVATASTWQVRQKLYRTSVERWRNYEKFIGPLKSLRDLD